MELLLHHTWRQRLFPLGELRTTSGQCIEVIDPGLHNHDAGPDFFNAKLKIDGQLWVGNVEVHKRASDWRRHGHHEDERYNNVVLHVVEVADEEATTQNGTRLPQLVLQPPADLQARFAELQAEEHYPPCHRMLPSLPKLHVHAWLTALTTERLEEKTVRIEQCLIRMQGDWEHTFFIALARAFGFGKNSDAFELWAQTIEPQQVGKHRDQPFQVEAFFLGQAGLLEDDSLSVERRDEHFLALQREYRFLQHKFALTPIPASRWKFLRLRPQNFPHRRLTQLAQLYASGQINLSRILEAQDLEQLRDLLRAETPEYWQEHYIFGMPKKSISSKEEKKKAKTRRRKHTISSSSIDLLIINAVVPMVFAYGRAHQDERLTERAFAWLEALPAERNHILTAWQQVGIAAQHAADAQALIHLRTRYCDRKDCLRCRFGQHYLQSKISH